MPRPATRASSSAPTISCRELKEVQDKNGDGYLGALEGGREAFGAVSKGDIRSAAVRPERTLVAVVHAAQDLRRAARRLPPHRQPDGARRRDRSSPHGPRASSRRSTTRRSRQMLNTEHGGMNEVLADLYADTGDQRWLDLSYRSSTTRSPIRSSAAQDNLAGKHGNCQIPKLIGSAARYGYTGDTGRHHRGVVLLGPRRASITATRPAGTGNDEYFGPPTSWRTARRRPHAASRATSTTCSS